MMNLADHMQTNNLFGGNPIQSTIQNPFSTGQPPQDQEESKD